MKLDVLVLNDEERRCMPGVSNGDLDAIFKLTDISYRMLWQLVVPEGLAPSASIPNDHWANAMVSCGPSYPRLGFGENADAWQARESQWREALQHYLMEGFEFEPRDEVVIVDQNAGFVTDWGTFVGNTDAFCPWKDVAVVIRRDSLEFARLVEDYGSVGKGTRKAIDGFDSQSFCTRNRA